MVIFIPCHTDLISPVGAFRICAGGINDPAPPRGLRPSSRHRPHSILARWPDRSPDRNRQLTFRAAKPFIGLPCGKREQRLAAGHILGRNA